MTAVADHAHYIHAVARALKESGFDVLSVGGHDWEPRGGHILLGVQDDWSDYEDPDADVRWDEQEGWLLHWRGMRDDLGIGRVPAPARIATAVSGHLGCTRVADYSATYPDVGYAPSAAEFEAALAAYEPA